MKLLLDPNITYAIALEGGGARGAYQVGAWDALNEAGIRFNAVSGTSVGAINGAYFAIGRLEEAKRLWRNIRFSQVMEIDRNTEKILEGNLTGVRLKDAASSAAKVILNKGFNVTPLYDYLGEVIDEDAIRASDVDFYIITYSITDLKELELRAKDLAPDELRDMILASAYLPGFRNEKLRGKRYADGGVRDVLPLHVLTANHYKNIIAIRTYGVGLMRQFRVPDDVVIHTVAPTEDLGGILNFNSEQSNWDMRLGYFDTQRLLYGLTGSKYYIDAQWNEHEAYCFIRDYLTTRMTSAGHTPSLRWLNEKVIPMLLRRLETDVNGDYCQALVAGLETAAEEAGIFRWQIYTEQSLINALETSFGTRSGKCPAFITELLF